VEPALEKGALSAPEGSTRAGKSFQVRKSLAAEVSAPTLVEFFRRLFQPCRWSRETTRYYSAGDQRAASQSARINAFVVLSLRAPLRLRQRGIRT
jgi:hypothetical protein